MGEQLIKPYEISVWEDQLTQNGFVENKLAIIGSDTMTGLNKIYDPVFNKKSNGERSLTFSLKYHYIDPRTGEEVINPFADLLMNERRVKLHYDNQWYEFIVKEHEENSDESTWTYTCTDAFVLELSKCGYNITFDSELNNNQGTAAELAQETIKNTDWRLGTVDNFKQYISEPLYLGVVENNFEALNTDDGTTKVFSSSDALYIFYSYIKNKDGINLQFIEQADTYTFDDDKVIVATNYRITDEVVIEEDDNQGIVYNIKLNGQTIITTTGLENRYQANRLVYKQLNTYDPVMERTVDRYAAGNQEVYRYIDYVYTTSDIVLSYITNGENFNVLEDGSLQGWNPYVDFEPSIPGDDKIDKLELVTWPELNANAMLADLSSLAEVEGYLKVKFKGALTSDYKNAIYNSGFENNASLIKSVALGDQFVFRWRAGKGDLDSLEPVTSLRAVVAKYTQDAPNPYRYYYKHIDPNNIIMEFDVGTPQELNNIITGGTLEENYKHTNDIVPYESKTYYKKEGDLYVVVANPQAEEMAEYYEFFHTYVIDDVVQTPSTRYVYKVEDTDYIWNGLSGDFELKTNSNYLPYYYLIATAEKAVSNKVMQDVTEKIGIFIYTTETETESVEEEIDIEEDGVATYDSETEEYTFSKIITPKAGATINVNYYEAVEGEEEEEESEVIKHTFLFVEGTSNSYSDEDFIISYDANTQTITCRTSVEIDNYEINYKGTQITTACAPIYIQDIQLTRFVADGDTDTPILIGNIPVATSTQTEYYYLKPNDGAAAEDVELYTSLEALKESYGIEDNILPLYNENSEKYLTITEAQSNCFNILQSIAETFECWIELDVDHDERGYITYENGKPNKFINLKEYAGVDNYAGFKYGINLESIERTVNSEEIVTKLIVDQSQCEYVDEGFVSIASAPSNMSGESYILNFDYYFSQGLLDEVNVRSDISDYADNLKGLNLALKEKEKQKRDLESSLTELGSKRNVFTELIATAQEQKTEALGEFENLTGKTYDEYRAEHSDPDTPDDNKLTEEDTIIDLLGQLYITSATINNYSGILTNVEQEYWQVRKLLRGLEQRLVKIWTGEDSSNHTHVYVEIDDYFPGFKFTIGEDEYESTVSKKFFDIEFQTYRPSPKPTINFIVPSGYSMDETSYTVNYNKVKVFKVTPNEDQTGLNGEIQRLRDQKEELNALFENKYRHFIQEGTWNSTDYIDSELYYLDALQTSKTSAFPTIDYTINVVEISELEGFEWYLFDTGDKTYVEDTEFFGWEDKNGIRTPAREEVIVSEVEWHLEEPDKNTITVQNYKTHFEDFFQRVSATVQTAQYNDVTYPKIDTILDTDGLLNPDVLGSSIGGLEYTLTSNGAITIEDDSIYIRNLTNPTNRVIINSEGIKVSSDGGENWSTAIDGQGINIGVVYTGSLNTNEVIIGNKDNPSFRWDKSGISAFKSLDDNTYDLQTYVRFDEYGLYGIEKDAGFKAQGLADVERNAWFALTWNGFFIRNRYTDGRVEITSDNDFRVLQNIDGRDKEKIKIGALEFDDEGNPTLYGIRIKNNDGVETFKTGTDGNITITGTINALGGNFADLVTVGKDDNDNSKPYIEIDGRDVVDGSPHQATIQSSNYGLSGGWMINADGDAVFNNITARGAIKTAVFEYAEIQAVGGIFLFRPSSTIRSAERIPNTNNVKIKVEKPYLFSVNDWCKISNYTDEMNEPEATDILSNNGLTHVYKIIAIDQQDSRILTLVNAYNALTNGNTQVINDVSELIGGALINMGNISGTSNYGIGINSSDNTVDLPARAISLFETTIDTNNTPKIAYNLRGILGTLPTDTSSYMIDVDSDIYGAMAGTQGIYTDNMYIGNHNQYVAFYQNGNSKQLTVKGNINATSGSFGQGDNVINIHYDSVNDINSIEYNGANGSFHLGTDGLSLGGNFNVTPDGTMSATAATLSGMLNIIGGTQFGQYMTFSYQKMLTESQPTDWLTNYNDYYIAGTHDDEYVKLDLSAAPQWEPNTYYGVDERNPQLIIGNKEDFAVTIDKGQITFWYNWQKVAFINGAQMEIPKSVMLEEMRVGQNKWSWRKHEDDNLELKWIGE